MSIERPRNGFWDPFYVWNQNWNQDTCFGRKRKTPIRIRGYLRLNQQLIAPVPVLGSENQTATGVRFWGRMRPGVTQN